MSDAMLTDDRLWRMRRRIEDATDRIVEHWPGTFDPPREPGVGRRPVPASRPPLSVHELAVRDDAYRDLRSWGQVVMEDRDLTVGPRSNAGPDLALFLARHADWLSRHEAAADCAEELEGHARRVEALAKGQRVRRVTLPYGCPELVLEEGDGLPGIERCPGSLVATVRGDDDMLPAVVRCTVERDHAWSPGQWQALGRRLGRVSREGVESLVNAIVGYRAG